MKNLSCPVHEHFIPHRYHVPHERRISLMIDRKMARLLLIAAAILISGCVPVPTLMGLTIHYIRIERTISPWDLSVRVGDEIRWVNLSGSPVTVFFDIGHSAMSCPSGVRQAPVVATVAPDDYVSLCAKQPGLFSYAVRLKTSAPGVIHTALIRVNGRMVQVL